MDALLINIVSNGPGQPSATSVDSLPEGGETTFAETLSSAMAASMQGTVKPEQQAAERSLEGGHGSLLTAPNGTLIPEGGLDLTADVDHPPASQPSHDGVPPRPPGPAGVQPQGKTPADSSSTPSGQAPTAGDALEDRLSGSAPTIDATQQRTNSTRSESTTQRSLGGQETQDPSSIRPVESLTGERGTSGLVSTPNLDVTAPAVSQQHSLDLDRLSDTLPGAVSRQTTTSFKHASALTGEERRVQEPFGGSHGVHDAARQTEGNALADDVGRGPQSAHLHLGRSLVIDSDQSISSGQIAPASDRPQPSLGSATPQTDLAGQPAIASLLAARPDAQGTVQRTVANQRPAQPLAGGIVPTSFVGDTDTNAYQVGAQTHAPLDLRTQRGLTPTPDNGQKPTASLLQNAGPDQAVPIAQAGPVEGVDPAVSDRLSTLLAVEGGGVDADRFEPLNAIGSTRSSPTPAPAPPGIQIGLQIAHSIANGVERLTVHLHPAELGSVDIQLKFDDTGRMSAQIVAERPETLELLQRDSRLLERNLSDNGLKFTNDGLSFSLKQDQQQQQAGQQFQQQDDTRHTAIQAGRAYDDSSNTDDQSPVRHVAGLRLLDIET